MAGPAVAMVTLRGFEPVKHLQWEVLLTLSTSLTAGFLLSGSFLAAVFQGLG